MLKLENLLTSDIPQKDLKALSSKVQLIGDIISELKKLLAQVNWKK